MNQNQDSDSQGGSENGSGPSQPTFQEGFNQMNQAPRQPFPNMPQQMMYNQQQNFQGYRQGMMAPQQAHYRYSGPRQQMNMNQNQRMYRVPPSTQIVGAKSGPQRDELCKIHFPEKVVTYDFEQMRAKCKVCIYNEVNNKYFPKNEGQESTQESTAQAEPQIVKQQEQPLPISQIQTPPQTGPSEGEGGDPLGFFKNELQRGTYTSVVNIINAVKQKKKKLADLLPQIDEAKRESVIAYRKIFKSLKDRLMKEKHSIISDVQKNVTEYKANIDEENKLIRHIIGTELKDIASSSISYYKSPQFHDELVSNKIKSSQKFIENFHQIDARIEKSFNNYSKDIEFNAMKEKTKDVIKEDFLTFLQNHMRPDVRAKQSVRVEEEGLLKIIHSFQWKSRLIHLCNIEDKTFDSKYLNSQFDIPLYSRSIAIDSGDIFLTGGHMKPQNIYLKKTFKYDRLFNGFHQKSDMLFHHADHSLVFSNNCIYAIGAYVYGKCHGHTEKYDVFLDSWVQCASMKYPRSGVGLCAFNNRYLFAFGGRNEQRQIMNAIEVYSIEKNEWKELTYIDKSNWVSSYMSLAYQVNENEIMIMGGKSQLSNIITKNSYVFNVETGKFKDGPPLGNPSSFMNTTIVFNNEIFVYGNDNNIHKFSFVENQWSIFKKRPKNR